MNAEQDRVRQFGPLEDGLRQASDWYLWGPYVSERQWGTVREDYSADGDAWDYFPHDQARSRAYRWGEDGLAGFSDIEQRLCLGLALWNGQDPILKERPFGLTGPQGNHGEDVKEYWWYLDRVRSHAWNRWRYHYPHLFDEGEFLSPYGLRALSAYHRDHPYVLDVEGQRSTIDYEPAESATAMFGGNSNWRGPIWFPLNYLIVTVLESYHHFFGDELTIEYPVGSGQRLTFDQITGDLRDRLISIFLTGPDGRRPCFGWVDKPQHDPDWKDNLLFNEYFHGDNAAGLGASHQTGWTGVVADLIRRRWGTVPALGDVMAGIGLIPAPSSASNSATVFTSPPPSSQEDP